LIPFILLKALIPIDKIRDFLSVLLVTIASIWAQLNYVIIESFGKIHWQIDDLSKFNLNNKKNYLVISNHQSWIDILALIKVFNLRIPYFRFFLKDSLKWIPFLGVVWWGMDYPFMKRYSKKDIEKNPKLKDENMISAKKSCKRFEKIPVSVMNFLEGTRFTEEKHKKSKSPFKHLLKPKSGGISLVLSALTTLDSILNVTIIYPNNKKNMNFWKFIAGELNHIIIKIEKLPIEKYLIGDYTNDLTYREKFQKWSNDLWLKKDALIEKFLSK
jgi:1-acyl-sn-glycerol-3-phosphate acyltransferase